MLYIFVQVCALLDYGDEVIILSLGADACDACNGCWCPEKTVKTSNSTCEIVSFMVYM